MAGPGGARPGAGRPKGKVNKRAEEFAQQFDALCKKHNFNLIEGLIEMCKDEDKDIALKARQTVMPYRYPKLRQVEVTGDGGDRQPVFKLIVESEKPKEDK